MAPRTLPKYLEAFVFDDVRDTHGCTIIDGPDLCTCVGPSHDKLPHDNNTPPPLPPVVESTICDIFFSEGGQFINSPTITNEMLPSVLEIFATMLEYKENVRFTEFKHKVYEALPTFFVEIAHGSRVDSGFRLLRRCARHAMDSNARDLIHTDGKLLKTTDGSVGIFMRNVIPASMKNNSYQTYTFLRPMNYFHVNVIVNAEHVEKRQYFVYTSYH